MKKYYDKLLHVTCSFCALSFAHKFMPFSVSIIIVLCLCIAKTIWNYLIDKNYKPFGDWISNFIGFVGWIIYEKI